MFSVASVFGYVLCAFVGLLGAMIIWLVFTGRIDLSSLLNEANGQASMARFQLLIFTFVIAVGLFAIIENNKMFPDVPSGVLTLLGISASTYAVGKGISYSQPDLLLKTATPAVQGSVDTVQAQASADQAAEHAAAAQQAATATQAAVSQAAAHAASAQKSAQQSATNAAVAQVAAEGQVAAAEGDDLTEQTTVTQVTVAQTKQP